MNPLLKSILFTNIISIFVWGLIIVLNQGISIGGTSLGQILLFTLFLFVMPILVIIVSGIYQYKNPNIKNYAKSLLIPLSYVIVALLLSLVWAKITNVRDESTMVFLLFWLQFVVTFFAVAIINFVIYLTRRHTPA